MLRAVHITDLIMEAGGFFFSSRKDDEGIPGGYFEEE